MSTELSYYKGLMMGDMDLFLASFRNNNHKIVLVKKKKKSHFMCFWFSHLWRPYVWMGP